MVMANFIGSTWNCVSTNECDVFDTSSGEILRCLPPSSRAPGVPQYFLRVKAPNEEFMPPGENDSLESVFATEIELTL